MADVFGTYFWNLSQVAPAWRARAFAAAQEHGPALNDGPRMYSVEWEGGRLPADVQVGRAGDAMVVVMGAARMRAGLPDQPRVAQYVAEALAAWQPIEPVLATLEGEFLLLAWDDAAGTAFLAVDPVGNRGLYYALGRGGLIWATHPRRVARLLGPPRINREALNLYFDMKGVPAPWTLLEGVCKVRPGHVLRLTREGLEEREYWPLAQQLDRPYAGDLDAASDELVRMLVSAIQRSVAGGAEPAGVFLSGGLDSTALLALARYAEVPVRAYTVGYTPAYHGDESPYARLAAQKLDVPIDVHLLSPRDVAELADEVLPRLAEPVADPTLLPLLFLARRAARPGQVVLDGTGADVILAGTTKYTAEHYVRMYARVPWLLRRGLIEPLGRLLPSSRRWRLTSLARKWQVFTTMGALPERERQVFWTRFMPRPLVAEILAPQWLCAGDLGTSYLRGELERPGTDDIGALSYMTLKCHTPWVDLLKLHSVEQEAGISVRKPYLAPELVEFGLSLPDAFKVQGSQGKIALRKACEGLIPPGTLQRGKAIFATPVSRWLGHELRDAFWDTLLHPTGLFDIAKIRTMVRQDTLGWRDWQSELWAVFMLQRWWIANSQ